MTASWSRARFSIFSRSTALEPAPPTPTSLMAMERSVQDLVRERQLVVMGIELHGSGGAKKRLRFCKKPPGRRAAGARAACELRP